MITIKIMHRELIGDDEDDYLRELAWLDAQDEMEYKMWLEEENKRKGVTKIVIQQVEQEELKIDEN